MRLKLLMRIPAITLVSLIALAGCSKSPESNAGAAANPDEEFLRSVRGAAPETAPADSKPSPTVTSVAATNVDPAAMAKVELPTDRFDMGLVENDRVAVAKMPIYNRGTAPLKISRISTSCGCTTGEMESAVIAPGGEGTLIIRVDPARIPGFFAEKTLTIYTNDPITPNPTLNVLTHVKPEVEIAPEGLDFGKIALGDGAALTARIRQLQEPALEVSNAALGRDLAFIEVSVEALPEAQWTTPGKREYTITARMSKDAPTGVYDEWIWVNTNITRYANIPIKLKGEIVGPYEVSPRTVAVRGVEPGEPAKGVLFIRSDKPLTVTDLKNSNSAVQATFRKTDEPNAYTFDANVPQRPASRALRDTWTITLDVDGETHVETVAVTIILSKDE